MDAMTKAAGDPTTIRSQPGDKNDPSRVPSQVPDKVESPLPKKPSKGKAAKRKRNVISKEELELRKQQAEVWKVYNCGRLAEDEYDWAQIREVYEKIYRSPAPPTRVLRACLRELVDSKDEDGEVLDTTAWCDWERVSAGEQPYTPISEFLKTPDAHRSAVPQKGPHEYEESDWDLLHPGYPTDEASA